MFYPYQEIEETNVMHGRALVEASALIIQQQSSRLDQIFNRRTFYLVMILRKMIKIS